ncbi:MAG: DUF1559 domain-containing protein [Phycisphaerales bacterium]
MCALRAFTLVDLLVSIAVVAVLLALFAPALSGVREATRRVVCSSNVRQIGLGLAMYQHMYTEHLPDSAYAAKITNPAGIPQAMMKLRITSFRDWDGLGHLYAGDFLDAPGVFYCPSHHGNFPSRQYAESWNSGVGQIVGNYHYRGERPPIVTTTDAATRPGQALVADGMASRLDFNHVTGCNVLRIDLSLHWYNDTDGSLLASLSPTLLPESLPDSGIPRAWQTLDGVGDR